MTVRITTRVAVTVGDAVTVGPAVGDGILDGMGVKTALPVGVWEDCGVAVLVRVGGIWVNSLRGAWVAVRVGQKGTTVSVTVTVGAGGGVAGAAPAVGSALAVGCGVLVLVGTCAIRVGAGVPSSSTTMVDSGVRPGQKTPDGIEGSTTGMVSPDGSLLISSNKAVASSGGRTSYAQGL